MSFSIGNLNPLRAAQDFVNSLAPGVGDTLVGVAKTAASVVDKFTPDAGDVFEELFDAAGLEAFGDIASLVANIGTGNVPAIISDVVDLCENMPDPGPPPAGSNSGAAKRTGCAPTDQAAGAPQGGSGEGGSVSGATGSNGSNKAAPTTGSGQAPSSASGGTEAKADVSGAAGKTDSSSGSGKADSSGKTAAKEFIARFDNPEAFLDAIKNGDLPPEVANSQEGMMMIQQRMGEITRMFQLMSQMLDALNQMSMGIVRNIRA